MASKIDFDKKYLVLYNEAVNKIFKNYTNFTSFHNPKHFRLVELKDVYDSTNYPLVDDEELTHEFVEKKKVDDEIKNKVKDEMELCRKKFLDFMKENLYDNFKTLFMGLNDADKYLSFDAIVKKVHQFIELMDVEMTNTGNNIVVTLHDIKTKYSSYDTYHCISERLFMAILLAIQMLHCPTPSPDRKYTLKFKFASTLFTISSLHQSSIKCAKNSIMSNLTSNDDPVAANIFDFDLIELEPEQLKAGGSKSRRRHRRHHKSKHARKTRRGRSRKFKLKTHRRRSARKNKKIYKNTYKRCK